MEENKEEKAKVIEEYNKLSSDQANVMVIYYSIAEEKRQPSKGS